MGWGLTICLWLGPPWFNYWFSFTLAYSRISHEYSSLFIIVINLIFFFRFDALTELGAFKRTEFLCIYILRVASGPRVKLVSCKSALNPPVVCSTDRSKAVVPVLVLLLVALWFILRGELLYVFSCIILFLCFFSPFSIAITSLGEERANLSAFSTFIRFVRFCLDLSVSSSSWGLGRAAVCDCGTPWTFLLPFFLFYEAICCMSFRVSFCSCVFPSFKYCDYLAWGRES